MPIEPTIIERAEQPYLGIQRAVTMATMPTIADQLPRLLAHLAERGITPVGPPFLRYDVIDMAHELVVEAGVPIPAADVSRAVGAGAAGGELFTGTLPGGRFVDATYQGHYDDLIDVTTELLQWAAGQSLAWDAWPTDAGEAWGCRLEQYLTDPAEQPDMTKQRTQLTFRLAD